MEPEREKNNPSTYRPQLCGKGSLACPFLFRLNTLSESNAPVRDQPARSRGRYNYLFIL